MIDGYREVAGQQLPAFLEPYTRTRYEYYSDVPKVDQVGLSVIHARLREARTVLIIIGARTNPSARRYTVPLGYQQALRIQSVGGITWVNCLYEFDSNTNLPTCKGVIR